ncbi:MAG: ammonia-forming cytochrome c nitrite reductase subunit c552 [Candidatus Latescibacterota bacterium]
MGEDDTDPAKWGTNWPHQYESYKRTAEATRTRFGGHAYMLQDQESTGRQAVPLTGSCLHCHASIMPLYRELGDGDATVGFDKSYEYSYKELNTMLHEGGNGHPVSCVDCHEPKTMALRVTRPGFIQGIQALVASDAPVAALPSIDRWRSGTCSEPGPPSWHN